MTLGKLFQKLKDLYGWDRGVAYQFADKRAYYKALADDAKEKMEKAKNMKEFNKAKFFYEDYMKSFDRADFVVRNSDHDATEEGWRN